MTLMKVPVLFLALGHLLTGQTTLISPTIRNGGFEDQDASDFASTPFWDSYFPEGSDEDPVLATRPRSGRLRGFASGFLDTGDGSPRIHPSQTIPANDWTIAEGDVFQLTAHIRPGAYFDVGSDSVQFVLHVVNNAGSPVPTTVGNADRLLSATAPPTVFAVGQYSEFTTFTDPVPAESPWIGQQLRLRVLVDGERGEFAMLDDIELIARSAEDLNPTAVLLASYPAEGNPQNELPDRPGGNATAGLSYGPGFGLGKSFRTGAGGVTLPVAISGSFSFSCRIRTTEITSEDPELRWSDGSAIIDGASSPTEGFGLSLRGPLAIAGVGETRLVSRTMVTDDKWHHVVFTRSPLGAIQLFVDGRLEDFSDSSPDITPVSDLALGMSRLGGRFFDGSIDDIHLYRGVLTAENVDALYLGTGDTDGDGFSNQEEVNAGTDWGSAQDYPRIRSIRRTNDGVEVEIDGKRARSYQLEKGETPAIEENGTVPDSVSPLEVDQSVELIDPDPSPDRSFYQVRTRREIAPKPNILLIVGDDHGYADISAFPNSRPDISTPNLDRIATGGAILTQAYVTSPVCSPSRCGFLTGRMQNEWDPAGGWAPRLPADAKHLAEYLKEAGYATAMVGKNDFGQPVGSTDNREHPTNHGFDQFFGFNAHAHDFWLHSQAITNSVRPAWPTEASAHLGQFADSEALSGFSTVPDGKWQTELFTDKAINYLTERAAEDQPFFLYLSHASVHALIHQAPKSYLDAEGVPELPLYDPATNTPENPSTYTNYYYRYSRTTPQEPNGMIADADMRKYYRAHLKAYDDQMGRLLDSLESLGFGENTIIVYLSDNGGEALTGANNQPLSGSKYTTFEGGLRVPMMIRWPGHIPSASTYNHVTSALDIVPTLLEAAGVEEAPQLRGYSLLRPLRDQVPVVPRQRTLFWRFNDQWAIRRGDWKLVYGLQSLADKHTSEIVFNEATLGKVSLFNLNDDPAEMNDLIDSPDPVIQNIRTDLQLRYDRWNSANQR